MTQTTHPNKEQVRSYMAERREARVPPPSPERIRQMLGWQLVEAEREMENRSRS